MLYDQRTYIDHHRARDFRKARQNSEKMARKTSFRDIQIPGDGNSDQCSFRRERKKRQKGRGISFYFWPLLVALSFLLSTPISSANIRDIKVDPVHHKKVHNFNIKPGVPITISFPYKISETIYGDSQNYVVSKIDPKTLGIKLLNTKTMGKSENGFTIIFENEKKISFVLHPTLKKNYDITVNFYEGLLPKNSQLEKKFQELESNYQEKVETFESSFVKKVDQYIAQNLARQGKLIKMKGEYTSHGITFKSKKKFIVGNRTYYLFWIKNHKYDQINPLEVELKMFRFSKGKMRNIQLIQTQRFCESAQLQVNQETLCSFAYPNIKDGKVRFTLELKTPSNKKASMVLLK